MPNNGMQRTRNKRSSHARLVADGGSCAPLMPGVRHLFCFMATDTLSHPSHYHLRRTAILGTSVCAGSLLLGILTIFWRESGGSLFHVPATTVRHLLLQATLGPLYMAFAFLLPITVPVLLALTIMVYFGSRMARIWLSALAFLLMGAYWLLLVKLIADGAFD